MITATALAEEARDPGSGIRDPGGDPDVTIETVASQGPRPGGARFGTLVHALLADAPLSGDEEPISRLAEAHGRMLGATPDEVAAAARAAAVVLRHPVLRAAARAAGEDRCYRETAITWSLPDGRLVEGHVDLAYLTDDEAVVVDFKTDRELDGALDQYRRQVQIYAAAVSAALGRPARAVLMRV